MEFENLASGTKVFYDDETRSNKKPIRAEAFPMRFDKKSRKIRVKKKTKKKKGKSAGSTRSLLGFGAFAVVLLGIFYFLLYSGHQKELRRIRQEKIQDDFDRICAAVILHAQEHGKLPSSEQGIAALVKKVGQPSSPGDSSVGTGSLERIPLDPWRNPYEYKGSARADEVTLISWGADGRQGGTGEAADVIRKGCRSTALPLR
jgi:general secretion pathway protein G